MNVRFVPSVASVGISFEMRFLFPILQGRMLKLREMG